MAEYSNDNQFVIKKNDKGDNPKRPDYKGKVRVEGVDFWLAGWIRTNKEDGSKFISGTLTKIEEQAPPPKPAKPAKPEKDLADMDDDIPF